MNIHSKIELGENPIFESANFRIVVCSNNHQWILQKRFGKSISGQGWQSISYHRSKDSLMRVYNEKTGDLAGLRAINHLFPSQFGGGYGQR